MFNSKKPRKQQIGPSIPCFRAQNMINAVYLRTNVYSVALGSYVLQMSLGKACYSMLSFAFSKLPELRQWWRLFFQELVLSKLKPNYGQVQKTQLMRETCSSVCPPCIHNPLPTVRKSKYHLSLAALARTWVEKESQLTFIQILLSTQPNVWPGARGWMDYRVFWGNNAMSESYSLSPGVPVVHQGSLAM